MPKRFHSCQWPGCIRTEGTLACEKACMAWLCPQHMKVHDCSKMKEWALAGHLLNTLAPEELNRMMTETGDDKFREEWK